MPRTEVDNSSFNIDFESAIFSAIPSRGVSAGAGLAPHAEGHSLLNGKVFRFGFPAGIILLFYLGVKERFFL